VPLIDDIRMDERFSRAVFSTSTNGVLVCMTGSAQAQTQLRWLDRSGRSLGDVGEPADYTYGGTPELSPDGGSAVLAIANRDRGTSDVWIIDLQSGRRRKLTVDTLDHPDAMWALDGKSVFVTSSDSGAVDRIAIDGTRSQRLVATQASDYHWPLSQHGHVLLYSAFDGERNHLRELDLSQGGMSTPFVATAGAAFHAQFSPDGRFVTYTSDQTGRTEVFVSAYPQPGGTWQVSQDGGSEPRWSREGKELIFVDRENYLVAVDVDASHAFVTGEARRLFQFHGAGSFWRYDVSFDGERFLVTTPLEENLKAPLTLITNWPAKVENR